MNTIRIERLDLKCRGVSPATARAAVGELTSALCRQLNATGAGMAETGVDVIRVAGTVPPTMLADSIAAHLTGIIRTEASPSPAQRKP